MPSAIRLLSSFLALIGSVTCTSRAQDTEKTAEVERLRVKRLRVEVLAAYPHDQGAFTQGLLWHEGSLYESTGHYGKSTLRRVDPTSGAILEQFNLDDGLFGEGLVKVGDRLIQLTWQEGLALVFDIDGLVPMGQFTYSGRGWGLAWDDRRLIMSDGSSQLTFRDPETFKELGLVRVTLAGAPLEQINEMEFVNGKVYANVLSDDHIYRFDPDSGRVRAVIDASGLLGVMERLRADVLNGIAFDPDSKTFWITGKYWPKVFQVVFVPVSPRERP